MTLNIKACVDTLATSALNRDRAFHSEIAVGLLVFSTENATDEAAKTVLRELYSAAGYICLSPAEKQDYKTVARRIGVSAALFEKLTSEKVAEMAGPGATMAKIRTLAERVGELGLSSIDAVKEFTSGMSRKARNAAKNKAKAKGKARAETNVIQFNRRQADRADVIHVATKHIRVDVDHDAPAREIKRVIAELTALLDNSLKIAA